MKIVSVNEPEKSGTGGFAPESRRAARSTRKFAINRYGFAGFGYAALGMAEAFIFPLAPGDLTITAVDAAITGTMIGIPAALLTFRQGVVSAAALSLLAIANAIGSGVAAANGEPYFTAASVIVNLGFLASFLRGGFVALATRRQSRFA